MSSPATKVGVYILIIAGITLAFRLANHHWPSPALFGVALGGSCFIWRKERDLNERIRREQMREAEQARRGKYGARQFRA